VQLRGSQKGIKVPTCSCPMMKDRSSISGSWSLDRLTQIQEGGDVSHNNMIVKKYAHFSAKPYLLEKKVVVA